MMSTMTDDAFRTGPCNTSVWDRRRGRARSRSGPPMLPPLTKGRLLVSFVLALTYFLLGALLVPAQAHESSGVLDRGSVVFDSDRTSNYEIFWSTLDGQVVFQLTNDWRYDSWSPRLSPDRRQILFYRTPRGVHDLDYAQASLWRVNADGSAMTLLLDTHPYGWAQQGHVEWSPDGTRLAMVGGTDGLRSKIFVTDANGRSPQQVTSGDSYHVDPSWAPDGRSLLFAGCPTSPCSESLFEIYRINVDGTNMVRLTFDLLADYDPYWAPDGSAIAWLRNTGSIYRWGIFVMKSDGTYPSVVIDDGAINSRPSWSSDSRTIYFHRSWWSRPVLYSVRSDGAEFRRVSAAGAGLFFADEYPVTS